MRKHLYWGHYWAFRPGVSNWHTRHIVRHGNFIVKQLRSLVRNEMHTNSSVGPRLNSNNMH